MRCKGSAEELERRRCLAVQRVLDGYSQKDVAKFLGVSRGSVSDWVKLYRQHGWAGLQAKPHPGRPRNLSPEQEAEVLSWISRSPCKFGFANELWTPKRIAQLIQRTWKVRYHPGYMHAWLAERRITSQKPRRRPRERNEPAIGAWKDRDWSRLKNGRRGGAPVLF
jgi:transposase